MRIFKINERETFKYSPHHFDDRFFGDIFRDGKPFEGMVTFPETLDILRDVQGLDNVTPMLAESDDTINVVFDRVFKDLERDKDLKKTHDKFDEVEEKARMDLGYALVSETNEDIVHHNATTYVIEKTIIADDIVYTLNDEEIIRFSTATLSDQNQVALHTVLGVSRLVWDSIGFVCSVINLRVPKANAVSNARFMNLFKEHKTMEKLEKGFIQELTGMVEFGSWKERAVIFKRALRGLGKALDLKKAVKAMYANLGWWDKVLAVGEFMVAISLIFVSAGASLFVKMLKVSENLTHVLQDIRDLSDVAPVEMSTGIPPELYKAATATRGAARIGA